MQRKEKWFAFGLLFLVVACTGDESVAPKQVPMRASATQMSGGAGNGFLTAWSQSHSSYPVQTQIFGTDTRLSRQYASFTADQNLLNFAAAHPGQLYINGDEPDQNCITPYDYAGIFHDFVAAVRGADPTARFSNAGFADPNDQCTPVPGEPYRSSMHYTSYATDFYNAYVQRYGVAPPVNEWRFHNFAQWLAPGDVNTWWSQVSSAAAWSVAHGANMTLGSWFLKGDGQTTAQYQDQLKRAMVFLINDGRINQAVYWSYESWGGFPHYLANGDGTLTPEGQTYSNVWPADVATSVTAVGSANAHARLQWTNTTTDWAIEAEFWRQPAGGTFAYDHTDYVAAGATQTPNDIFNLGDRVKGRVRYTNRLGVGPWSAYSGTILMH